jgi:BlaI family penicillinase repressor
MPKPLDQLGRRERQIVDILIRRGRATANDVLADLPDPPSYSAVRGMLRLLESKGYVSHEWDGPRHVYRVDGAPAQVRKTATKHFLRTFFDGSMESAVAAMLGASDEPVSEKELKRMSKLIDQARKNGGRP